MVFCGRRELSRSVVRDGSFSSVMFVLDATVPISFSPRRGLVVDRKQWTTGYGLKLPVMGDNE